MAMDGASSLVNRHAKTATTACTSSGNEIQSSESLKNTEALSLAQVLLTPNASIGVCKDNQPLQHQQPSFHAAHIAKSVDSALLTFLNFPGAGVSPFSRTAWGTTSLQEARQRQFHELANFLRQTMVENTICLSLEADSELLTADHLQPADGSIQKATHLDIFT